MRRASGVIWPATSDQKKQESVRKKEEEEDKHGHYDKWNLFATEILNVCIT